MTYPSISINVSIKSVEIRIFLKQIILNIKLPEAELFY